MGIESKYDLTDFVDIEDDLDGFVRRVSMKDGVAEGDVTIVPLLGYDVDDPVTTWRDRGIILAFAIAFLGLSMFTGMSPEVLLFIFFLGIIWYTGGFKRMMKVGFAVFRAHNVMYLTPSSLWVVTLGKRRGRFLFIGGSRVPRSGLVRKKNSIFDAFSLKSQISRLEFRESSGRLVVTLERGRFMGVLGQKRVDRIYRDRKNCLLLGDAMKQVAGAMV